MHVDHSPSRCLVVSKIIIPAAAASSPLSVIAAAAVHRNLLVGSSSFLILQRQCRWARAARGHWTLAAKQTEQTSETCLVSSNNCITSCLVECRCSSVRDNHVVQAFEKSMSSWCVLIWCCLNWCNVSMNNAVHSRWNCYLHVPTAHAFI